MLTKFTSCRAYLSLFLYCCGVIPVSRLKYFPKKETLGKFREYAISRIGRLVDFSCALASTITTSEMKSMTVFPVIFFTVLLKCAGVIPIFFA